jgi:hypothetical protein
MNIRKSIEIKGYFNQFITRVDTIKRLLIYAYHFDEHIDQMAKVVFVKILLSNLFCPNFQSVFGRMFLCDLWCV